MYQVMQCLVGQVPGRNVGVSMQMVGIPVLGGLDFITVSEIIYCKAEVNCTNFI
jgi:hypothetical protein